jgi:hypothetical protein
MLQIFFPIPFIFTNTSKVLYTSTMSLFILPLPRILFLSVCGQESSIDALSMNPLSFKKGAVGVCPTTTAVNFIVGPFTFVGSLVVGEELMTPAMSAVCLPVALIASTVFIDSLASPVEQRKEQNS